MTRCFGTLTSLWLMLTMGFVPVASAQQAVLYEMVENVDTAKLATNHRVSYWTAQGTAQVGTPFCPAALVPAGGTSCTITAFGMDDIDFVALMSGAPTVGNVWANVVAVVNEDNPIDGAEVAAFTGQITGDLTILAEALTTVVTPHLAKKKSVLGPELLLIYIVNGKFFPDTAPTVRTSPPAVLPSLNATARFESTFRLPFAVATDGKAATPERGKNAYYLGDDGALIRVDTQNEYAHGFPLLRGEVFFINQVANQ